MAGWILRFFSGWVLRYFSGWEDVVDLPSCWIVNCTPLFSAWKDVGNLPTYWILNYWRILFYNSDDALLADCVLGFFTG